MHLLTKDLSFLSDLPDPVPGFKIGDTRQKLKALGEEKIIRVVAIALVARIGSRESCKLRASEGSGYG